MKKYIFLLFGLFIFIPDVFAVSLSSSYYKVDDTNKIIYGVKRNTSEELFSPRVSGDTISVLDDNNQVISNSSSIKTGYKVSLGTDTYNISVLGDIEGGGNVTKNGIIESTKYIIDSTGLSLLSTKSADLNSDGNIKMDDVMMLLTALNHDDDKIHFIRQSSYYLDDSSYDKTKGDAILLESNGLYAMVDTGDSNAREMVTDYLKKVGVKKLDFILITHLHGDHSGGARYIAKKTLGNIPVDRLYIKRYSSSLPGDIETIYHYDLTEANRWSSFKTFLGYQDDGTFDDDSPFKDTKIIYTQNIDNENCPTSSNQAFLICHKEDGCKVKNGETTETIAQWGTNNLAQNCTGNIELGDMDIKLYNTGYVMKPGDINVIEDGIVYENYNANYESVYLYITVNNKKIVLAADGLGNSTADGDGNFPNDGWYDIIKDDAKASSSNHIDILKAPHHGTKECAYRFRALYPDNVIVSNSTYNIGDKADCISRLKYYYTPTIRYTDNYAPKEAGGTTRANGDLAATAIIAGFNKSNGRVSWCTDTRTDCSWN